MIPEITGDDHRTVITFNRAMRVASWAPHGKGIRGGVRCVVNRTLARAECQLRPQEIEKQTRTEMRRIAGAARKCVALFTSVPQRYHGWGYAADTREDGAPRLSVRVFCTAGISDALSPGDPTMYNELNERPAPPPGTINLVVIVDRPLDDGTYLEAIQQVTHGKSLVLFQRGERSFQTGEPALFTGTDCIALCAPQRMWRTPRLKYAGGHVRLGELLNIATMKAVTNALSHRDEYIRVHGTAPPHQQPC